MNDATRQKLAQALVDARLHKRYTQNDLASLMCISRKALSDYECGINLPPIDRLAELIRILDDEALNRTVMELMNLRSQNGKE